MTTLPIDRDLLALADAFDALPSDRQHELLEDVDLQVAPLLHQHAGEDPRYLAEVRRLVQDGKREQAMAWVHLAQWKYFNAW